MLLILLTIRNLSNRRLFLKSQTREWRILKSQDKKRSDVRYKITTFPEVQDYFNRKSRGMQIKIFGEFTWSLETYYYICG